jgi:hypothetical protein
LQPFIVHPYCPQLVDAWIGQVVAEPEQTEAGVNDDPLQTAAAQVAVELRQSPAPSQTLVRPQGLVPAQRVSVAPDVIGAQLPAPLRLHAWQAGQLVLPQQTLSTQWPLMHSPPAPQAAPLGLSAQFFVLPDPWHVRGAMQSALVAHDVLQAVPPHTYGEQSIETASPQAPLPLQRASVLAVEPEHVATAQTVVVGAFAQAPAPLHAPVFPQGADALGAHIPRGSVVPADTFAHVPRLPDTLHAWHIGHDADPQQMRSTQVSPVRQSAVAVQAPPCRTLLPHRLVFGSQIVGATQSASLRQAALQDAAAALHR